MFTGLVETAGHLVGAGPSRIEIESSLDLTIGDSIAVNGVCVTVTSEGGGVFGADISEETRRRTTLGGLEAGARVNLERPLLASGRIGGHIVQGHVDGVGRVVEVLPSETGREVMFEVPEAISRYLAEKGSVAVDGVSLTVTNLNGVKFGVALVPLTLEATNLGSLREGDAVNIEVDILAKYVERLWRS